MAQIAAHEIQNLILDHLRHSRFKPLLQFCFRQGNRIIHQISNDLIHIATVKPNLRKLRRLDFHERRLRDLRQPSRDFRLPAPGRANHQNILGNDFVSQIFRAPMSSPSIPQRDRHRSFRRVLPDDVIVQKFHHFRRRQVVRFYARAER